jgi:hypothetical protein
MDDIRTPSAELPIVDPADRARSVRSRLPGQVQRQRVETAELLYGPLYGLAEIRARVGETLARRVGYVRGAALEPIETYRGHIPDEALLKWDDAVQAGLFSKFLVATPTYYKEIQPDPWILGEVIGTDRWAVIAQWG